MSFDDAFLWHLIAGTKGGFTRFEIMGLLMKRPYNANQISSKLNFDYKTVRYHLGLLLENGLVSVSKEKKYGELYFLTDFAKSKMPEFEMMWREDSGKG